MLIVTLIPIGGIVSASDSSEITATIDNRPIYFDVAPQKINGRVMVPLRAIFESLGAEVGWENSTQRITGKKDGTEVIIHLNEMEAKVDGKTVRLDAAATKINGRTFVPARFVAESFGAEVKWDEIHKQVVINTGAVATEDRYYFVYNSQMVTDQDFAAIKLYINKFKNTHNVLFDSSKYQTAPNLYDALKAEHTKQGGRVAGIQIFGLEKDVPSFDYKHKINFVDAQGKYSHIEEVKETIVTDFFYSTFVNDSKYFTADLSVYKVFDEKAPVSLIPDWPVSRLLLTKGEIAGYIDRYYDYRNQTDSKSPPTVAFASPTFLRNWEYSQEDDVTYFIKQLGERFGLFNNLDYRLYTNKLGSVVSNPTAGDMSVDNLIKENKAGVMDLLVSGHGGPQGIVQTITPEGVTGQNGQKYLPFMTMENVNTVLSSNYYTAFFWSCTAVEGLNADNFVHEALTKGKMINPISATSMLANNGTKNYTQYWDETASTYKYREINYDDLKNNNPHFLVYHYFAKLDQGKTRLQSLHEATALYAQELLKHQDTQKGQRFEANFECGFMNILALHYLGLADYE
ncbi:hypothetical protein H7F31_00025 [Paenibacillus sp. PAMC21692]|nr:hypothetical protein H7F31_00025 [Paenibacillus sp. PAMC21692]